MSDVLSPVVAALKETVRNRSRGRLDLLAFAVSPDGRWAVTLLNVRDTGYWRESLYEYGDDGWIEHTTSNGGLAYTAIGEDPDGNSIGVLRYYGRAPADAEVAIIRWRGVLHEVPVQNGHFAFAAWDARDDELDRLATRGSGRMNQHDPEVVRFEQPSWGPARPPLTRWQGARRGARRGLRTDRFRPRRRRYGGQVIGRNHEEPAPSPRRTGSFSCLRTER
jgi:hypothetical protein